MTTLRPHPCCNLEMLRGCAWAGKMQRLIAARSLAVGDGCGRVCVVCGVDGLVRGLSSAG